MHINISQKILANFITLSALTITLLILLGLIVNQSTKLTDLQNRQFSSHKLAAELRMTSDELTRMARTYMATGDPHFKEYFETIRDIRDGEQPRPDRYDLVYWDYVAADHNYTRNNTRQASILTLMEELNFSTKEISLLNDAKSLSDELIKIEIQAFHAMDGITISTDGSHISKVEPNQLLALSIINSEDYHQRKAKIMDKINSAFLALESRTNNNLKKARASLTRYYQTAGATVALLIVFCASGYFYFIRNFINPLVDLRHKVKKIHDGEFEFADTVRTDEIGRLLHEFVDMAHWVSGTIDNLEDKSHTDPLTQTYNRSGIDEELEKQKYNFERYDTPCSLIIADIDNFKAVNDEFGHITGDKVLVEVAAILKENIRRSDTVGRWGGEEFLIVCANTSIEQVLVLAEELRGKISQHVFSEVRQLTASFGTSTFEKNKAIITAVNEADKAMYKAKKAGRNKVY
jgi:diguanylate cyclase (GGDEF)-like protein